MRAGRARLGDDGRRDHHSAVRGILREVVRAVLVHHPQLVPHVAHLAVRVRAHRHLAVVVFSAPLELRGLDRLLLLVGRQLVKLVRQERAQELAPRARVVLEDPAGDAHERVVVLVVHEDHAEVRLGARVDLHVVVDPRGEDGDVHARQREDVDDGDHHEAGDALCDAGDAREQHLEQVEEHPRETA